MHPAPEPHQAPCSQHGGMPHLAKHLVSMLMRTRASFPINLGWRLWESAGRGLLVNIGHIWLMTTLGRPHPFAYISSHLLELEELEGEKPTTANVFRLVPKGF